ncbi:MAG: PEP-CTERM sorting domain-containing protein [Isosphaeraceae bacterium]|nr:PEP-CTERM sorting domain-containing protein [Isosphaeraceae bacterium]
MKNLRTFAYACVALALAGSVRADFIAYDVRSDVVGNQAYGGSIGLDFNVNSSILVNALGAFDNGGNGLFAGVTVTIYNRTSQAIVAQAVVPAGTSAPLINGSRFISLPNPIKIDPGNYTVSAVFTSDLFFNVFTGTNVPSTLNSGGGLVSFVGTGRYGLNTGFPTIVDSQQVVNPYAGGTFRFEDAIPEPSSLVLMGIGSVATAGLIRRRRKAA